MRPHSVAHHLRLLRDTPPVHLLLTCTCRLLTSRRHHFKKEEGVAAIEETIDAHLVEASKVLS